MILTGTFVDGAIVLDKPLDMANGERLSLVVDDDRCADGSKWPVSELELEAWCQRIESLPALFDTDEDRQAFESGMRVMRQEQVAALSARGDKVAALFQE